MEGRPLDDAKLVEEAQRGDVRAYEELVLRYQDLAFRTAYLITGEVADERTMNLIEQHFLLQVPRSRLTEDLGSLLRALLVLAPTPDQAG